MWNAIVKANCARAKPTASQPSNIAATCRYGPKLYHAAAAMNLPRLLPRWNCCGIKDARGPRHRQNRSTRGVEEAGDGAVQLLVLALAVVLEHDFSALVDDILRRPVLV